MEWHLVRGDATLDPFTTLNSCIVRFAGGSGGFGIRLSESDPVITRCLIRDNVSYGIRAQGSTLTAGHVSGNLLRNNGLWEISGFCPEVG